MFQNSQKSQNQKAVFQLSPDCRLYQPKKSVEHEGFKKRFLFSLDNSIIHNVLGALGGTVGTFWVLYGSISLAISSSILMENV